MINRAMGLMVIMALVATVHPALAGPEWKTLDKSEFGFQMRYPSDWKAALDQKTNVIAKYGLPLRSYDKLAYGKTIEARLYVLDNDKSMSVADFFLRKKMKSTVFIERQGKTVNGLDVLWVGYSYDPPRWDIIKYEVEIIAAVSADTLAYVQMSGTTDVEPYRMAFLVEEMAASFEKR